MGKPYRLLVADQRCLAHLGLKAILKREKDLHIVGEVVDGRA